MDYDIQAEFKKRLAEGVLAPIGISFKNKSKQKGKMRMSLSIGKRRGLAQCSTERGLFAILALDHRGNLRRAINPNDPDGVTYETMVAFKREVIAAIANQTSAVLVDPEIGAAPIIQDGSLPGKVGMLVAVEATGYTGDPTARASQILPGWSVEKIRRMGASGVKLLVYYHPDSDMAKEQEDLVEQVAEDCVRCDLPLFLEPLSYSLEAGKKLSSTERHQVVVETASRLTPLGIDVLKAEFPLNVEQENDENTWVQACLDVSQASRVPWTLLSAGVDFETYLRQVTIACQCGASGILAGRAVWSEAAGLQGEARQQFLRTTAAGRMARLAAVCDALGTPWTNTFPAEMASDEAWYSRYPGLC